MKMEEFTIKRDFGPDIVFQGELLVRSEQPCRQPSAFGRWHDVAVYRRSDGMWIVRIDFKTLCLHERPRTEVEVVDRPDDVEMVLSVHEPGEYLDHRRIRPRRENDKRRFRKTLVTDYDSVVNDVMTAMAPYIEEYHARPPSVPDQVSHGGWRDLLQMVGIHQPKRHSEDDPAARAVDASSDRGHDHQ